MKSYHGKIDVRHPILDLYQILFRIYLGYIASQKNLIVRILYPIRAA